MNLKLAGLGAEPKKVAAVVILAIIAGVVFMMNRTPSDAAYVAPKPSVAAPPQPVIGPRVPTKQVSRSGRSGASRSSRNDDFKPSLKPRKDSEIDRTSIDPTLHLELLTKLKNVKVEGGGRSLFEISLAPPVLPKVAEPGKILPPKPYFTGPNKPPPPPPPPPKPPNPPIPLKFYGFVHQTKPGVKRAFFLDGEEIIFASEGDLVKKRYKIIRIGVNSAVVEDTQVEHNQQTLPLVEEIAG